MIKDFILEIAFTLIGIGAASGILYHEDSIYVISDDSNYLYRYRISTHTINETLLINDGNTAVQLSKSKKRDFEAITVDGDRFHIYGSGSSDNGKRNMHIAVTNNEHPRVEQEDFTFLYRRLQARFSIPVDDFNIEGAIHHHGTVFLFNRGNGPLGANGIFRLSQQDTAFIPIDLPRLGGVGTGFTDAILLENTIYFLAAAEDNRSVYQDGAIRGTLLGTLSYPDLELQSCIQLSDSHKFEGIALLDDQAGTRSFLLCEDPDNGTLRSTVYKLTITY